MKPSYSTAKNTRAFAPLVAILAGMLLQFPGTAAAQTSADLAIAMYNTPLDVFVNDYMPYTMFVTNLGPGTVSSVVVTNILPSGFSLIDASPAYTQNGNALSFNLGSLTNLQVVKLSVRAAPSSAGTYTFSSSVSAANNSDPSGANNSASFSVGVGNFLSGNLSSSVASAQYYDGQVGYVEQWIQLSNNGSSPVASARIIISGLTNWLGNAAGTNNGNPFIVNASSLNPGQSVNMLLQFAARSYFSFSNSQMQAFATPLANLTPPPNLGKPIANLLEVRIPSNSTVLPNSVLIEFASIPNRTYTVLYSDNPQMANPVVALPSIVAPANYTFWEDYGPPTTLSYPTNTTPRYYRVYLNP